MADVHILGQNMINSVSEKDQKLLVFTDNRQDAAFQAGWMQDHARRYRLRHLVHDFLAGRAGPTSLGDIQEHLLTLFRRERDLAMALAPEVYSQRVEEAFGKTIEEDLRKYLRIHLVRELGTGFKQRDGLEVWGLARIVYKGLTPDAPEIRKWAEKLGRPSEEIVEGISTLLDAYRRNRLLWDEAQPIYSRYWAEGDPEILRGYLPLMDFPPKGIKQSKEEGDSANNVIGVFSRRGQTLSQNFVSKWGLAPDECKAFLQEVWDALTGRWRILAPVTLTGSRGRALPGCAGLCQVDTRMIGIVPQRERYRCNVCQRVHARMTPNGACTGMHCRGTIRREEPPADDYNVALLGMPFSMVMPQEHSAQVPAKVREKVESEFKRERGRYNCLVATPTLELGVDIGALDMILMRNVPPKASNYWQRAGRAGRRHRMAVIYTYCRRSIHDAYFFEDPVRMLGARIDAPRFNLRNEVMLRKHVHAAVLSELIRFSKTGAEGGTIPEFDAVEIRKALEAAFPPFIVDYLFVEGRRYREEPYDVTSLATVISKHEERLVPAVSGIFSTYWPEEAAAEVAPERLSGMVGGMSDSLQGTVNRLHRRLMWALETRKKLMEAERAGILDDYEERLRDRCERYIKDLANKESRTYTLSVLAMEGFLPGYGIYQGGIVAFAGGSLTCSRPMKFELSRPQAIAAREFMPGNLIYANSGRFKVVRYHLPVREDELNPEDYIISLDTGWIGEKGGAVGGYAEEALLEVRGLPICDVDLGFVSRISDEEQNRFQMPVRILGYRKPSHNGGDAFSCGEMDLLHLRGQHVRLVNIGPADRVKGGRLGYPVCAVCGAARSPYASDAEHTRFKEIHRDRCGTEPGMIVFSADVRVDGLLFQSLESQQKAYNLGEVLRIGAGQVLEMDSEDLQILLFPQADGRIDLFLYDPMPGGSGLLKQILERWPEVMAAADRALAGCPSACSSSCYECMRTYRNLFYHGLLDRKVAREMVGMFTGVPEYERAIEPEREAPPPAGESTFDKEERLGQMLQRAGFPPFDRQGKIVIGTPVRETTPDFLYEDLQAAIFIAIYMDGLSKGIHGNPERQRMDRIIRAQVEARGYTVVEIASSELDDRAAMLLHFKKLAFAFRRPDQVRKLESDAEWQR